MKETDPVVKRVVLDVLKPHDPAIDELASKVAHLQGIEHVSISLSEIDQNTESVKVAVEGNDVNIDMVRKTIEEMGAVVHSLDEVSVVKRHHART